MTASAISAGVGQVVKSRIMSQGDNSRRCVPSALENIAGKHAKMKGEPQAQRGPLARQYIYPFVHPERHCHALIPAILKAMDTATPLKIIRIAHVDKRCACTCATTLKALKSSALADGWHAM